MGANCRYLETSATLSKLQRLGFLKYLTSNKIKNNGGMIEKSFEMVPGLVSRLTSIIIMAQSGEQAT